MLNPFKRRDKRTKLEKEIDDLLDEMSFKNKSSSEYATNVELLKGLYDAKGLDRPRKVSPDTIAIIVANLLGIVLILKFEQLNTITSRAINFVLKGRV